jgi:disulfide bond formation protein DsbB
MRSEVAMSEDRLAGRLMLIGAVVFAIAAATILTAHIFERFGGFAPCPLCLQERYAYYFAVPVSVIVFFAARAEAMGVARILLLLIALGFLINAGVGIYHSGIEWKWWAGPVTCSGGTALDWGKGGLAAELEHAQLVRCDEAGWRFLWLSFAGWNAVVSGLLALIAGYGVTQKR